MAYVITSKLPDDCVSACLAVCPMDCILGPHEERMVIDPDDCIDCGACAAECPADAIVHDSHASAADIARNAEGARLIRLRDR